MIDIKPWGEINTSQKNEADACIMGIPFFRHKVRE